MDVKDALKLAIDATKFCNKAELLKAYETQRVGAFAALAKVNVADLDKPTGVEYAPPIGENFSMHARHSLMHAAHWATVRRQLGRLPMF
jgi:hypothetical protein